MSGVIKNPVHESGKTGAEKEYWTKKLEGELIKGIFPYDNVMGTEDTAATRSHEFEISGHLFEKLNSISNNSLDNLFAILSSCLSSLLYRYTGNRDFVTGFPIHKQSIEGEFINTFLVLRNQFNVNSTFKDVLIATRRNIVEACDNANYPLLRLLEAVDGISYENGSYKMNTVVLLENIHDREYVKPLKPNLMFSFLKLEDCLKGTLIYNSRLYESNTIEKIAKGFTRFMKKALEDVNTFVNSIEILSDEEKMHIIGFNQTDTRCEEDKTFISIFEEKAEQFPDKTALVSGKNRLSYGELNEKANQIARALNKMGVNPDTIVGILVEQSINTIISVLGVLKAGGAYLPLEKTLPNERLQYIIEDSGMEVLISAKSLTEEIKFDGQLLDIHSGEINSGDTSNPVLKSKYTDLAYVIYTSGTTGLPKGVLIENHSLANYIKWFCELNNLNSDDKTMLLSSFCYDLGYTSVFTALSKGCELHIPDKNLYSNPNAVLDYIHNNRITYIKLTPSLFNVIVNSEVFAMPKLCDSLRLVVLGGEKIGLKDIKKFNKNYPHTGIMNHYGPTETTIGCIAGKVDFNNLQVLKSRSIIGKPINNTRIHIVNSEMKPVPVGVPGEIVIEGEGVARGYVKSEALTREKFIKDQYISDKRMYRSGDMGRWMPDGSIEFIGRVDNQVKIRGFRIETGEIESKLLKQKGVKDALVIPGEDSNGDRYLCAYLISDSSIIVNEIREGLAKLLPDYMIPSYFVQLDKLPLTPNGKVDKRKLPEPKANMSTGDQYEAPSTKTEEKFVKIWQEVLGVERIGINDNFFELGGHSLKATILVSRIHKEMNIEIPIMEVFGRPTIKEMVTFIEEADKSMYSSIAPVDKMEYYPLSSAQMRTYVLTRLEEKGTLYNKPGTVLIEGKIDIERFENTLHKLIERHETLRTSFHIVDDEPVQRIHDNVEFHVEYLEDEEKNVPQRISELVKPFDLSKAPLLKVALINIGEDRHIMMYDMHHIISDGTSMRIVINEFAQIYSGKTLSGLRIQYKDYSMWQNRMMKDGLIKKQEEYWKEVLDGDIPVLNLPADYIRPALQSFEGERLEFKTSKEVKQKINSIARESGSTTFMVLLAAFNILLMKYTGQEDIIVGSPIAGRPHADLENMVGMFINTLAMRNRPDGEKTFKDFLSEVRQNALSAYVNQDYQFEELVEKLGIRRDMSRNPLFDVMLIMQNTGTADIELKDLKLKPIGAESGISKFDLTFDAVETEESINFSVEYATRLFKRETIERMGTHFIKIMEEVIKNPDVKLSEVDMLSLKEKQRIIYYFNETESEYPKNKTIHELFEEQALRTPDNIAVVFEENSITYRELNEKANQLAIRLKAKGVKRGCIVGIMVERSLEMITGIMGILKAGGAYLPIDPDYPEDRINYMLKDSDARIVLAKNETGKKIKFNGEIIDVEDETIYETDGTNVSKVNKPEDLAYVIYTSGSTGKPKGVMIEHTAVINFIEGMAEKIEFKEGKTILNVTTISFDIFVLETILALVKGLKIVTANRNQQSNPEELKALIQKNRIEMLQMTPSRMQTLLNENGDLAFLSSTKEILLGGEILNEVLLNKLKACKNYKIYNMYGPTETTVWSAASDLSESDRVDIGKPVANTKIFILDKNNNIQPVGIPGELCIAGDGLARGYLNQPALTEEKFVSNPFIPEGKMYRTGDLARWMPDGKIEFIGRMDNQVKIRGYRIETGEIETHLLSHDLVKEAAVTVGEDKFKDRYLCAYIAAEGDLIVSSLREHLLKELPEYMIPSYFIKLDKLPLTPNGKLDRKALPEADGSMRTGAEYEAPVNETQQRLVNIWSEVLGIEKIGINDNFFELGGHSLKATILVSRIHRAMNAQIPLKAVFRRPTVKGLEEYIKEAEGNLYNSIKPSEKRDFYPLSPAQRRLFVLNRFKEDTIAYNLPGTVMIEGDLDVGRFENTFLKIIERHETLRTSFEIVDGEPVQRIHDCVDFHVEYLEEEEETAKETIQKLIKPFDLEKAPLMRVTLIKVKEDRHIMLYDMHHIISDGVSMNVITREFSEIYRGTELPPLNIQYRDYTLWQNRLFEEGVISRQEEYWKEIFKDDLPVLNLQTDYKRPLLRSFEGDSLEFVMESGTKKKIDALARETGTTIYMVLLAAFNTLLMKYTGQRDIIIGSPIAGRQHADLENIVGMFVNTIAMRNRPKAESTFLQFLYKVKENSLKAFENQDYQFEELIDKLNVERDTSRNPLFDVMLVMQNAGKEDIELEGLVLKPFRTESNAAKYDLSLIAMDGSDRVHFRWEYSTKLFKKQTIECMALHFNRILEVVLDNPQIKLSDADMITEDEKQCIIYGFNKTSAEYPYDKTIHRMYEEQVEKTPEKTAIVYKGMELKYRELNERANQLARVLRQKGVRPDSLVGIMMERSPELIVGIMGILKSGGAYLPVAADYPEDRIRYMIEDSGIQILLTQSGLAQGLEIEAEILDIDDEKIYEKEKTNLKPVNTSNDLMYVIYTSGTTGKPKGVMLEHRSVSNFVNWRMKEYKYSQDDVTLQMLSYSFDGFGANLFPAILSGGKVVIVPGECSMDFEYINTLIKENCVTNMSIVPSMYSAILDFCREDALKPLRFVVLAGEKCEKNIIDASKSKNPDLVLINEYGPTENSITTTALIGMNADNASFIGTPVSNNRVFILDNNQGYKKIQPIGVPGELCISGDSLARGYLNRPELTAQKFIPNPHIPGTLMYCTGDLVRWLPDGTIEFLGRIDHQVKIRGFRIELGEIEEALLKHDRITEAVVTSRQDNNIQNLCAYIASDYELKTSELREYLSNKLPAYMIPAYFVRLKKLPLTPNGKLDLKALPEPIGNIDTEAEYEAPSNSMEEELSKVWQEVLGLERVGINSNFFDLGGNSMSLIKVQSSIENIYPGVFKITDLFSYPTIRKLVEYAEKKAGNILGENGIAHVKLPDDYFSGDIHGTLKHTFDFVIKEEMLEGIRAIAQKEKVEVDDVLLAVYIYLFADISSQDEIMIQTMINGYDAVSPLNVNTGEIESIGGLVGAVMENRQGSGAVDTYSVKDLKYRIKDKPGSSIIPAFFKQNLMTDSIEILDYYDVLMKFEEYKDHIRMEFEYSSRLREEKGNQLVRAYTDLIGLIVDKYINE